MANKSQGSFPNTAREAIEGMAARLDPQKAQGINASIQFKVSPSRTLESGGNYYLSIASGKCEFSTGMTSAPTLTISTPADVWLKIARKELNGAFAFMTGKYKAHGQIGLLLKMDALFSKVPIETELAAKS